MPSSSPVARAAAVAAVLVAPVAVLPAQCGIDTNYGTNLNLADDAVSLPQRLGFTFPFAGSTYDSMCVSSNGFVYLYDTNSTLPPPSDPRCCNGNLAAMLASTSPMVCALWTDLNPTAAGAGVYFNTAPNRAFASYVRVPEFVAAPGAANTFQITLHPSGLIELHFDSDCGVYSLTLTGWSPGNGATNPGPSNLAAVPITTTSATVYELFTSAFDLGGQTTAATPNGAASWMVDRPPGCAWTTPYGAGCRAFPALRLLARPGSRPVLNSSFAMQLENVSATAAGGVLVLGVTNPNLNLGFLGLPPNCVLLASLDVLLPFPTVTPTTIVTVPVPNNNALIGRALNAQTVVIDPALSGLAIALANGLRLTFGF